MPKYSKYPKESTEDFEKRMKAKGKRKAKKGPSGSSPFAKAMKG